MPTIVTSYSQTPVSIIAPTILRGFSVAEIAAVISRIASGAIAPYGSPSVGSVVVDQNVIDTEMLPTFDGETVLLGDVLLKSTKTGDCDLNGTVDPTDQALFDNGKSNNLAGWFNGDFNYDGLIDAADQALLDANVG